MKRSKFQSIFIIQTMYSKDELSAKSVQELQDIAKEISAEYNTDNNQEELIYAILDKQAVVEGETNPLGTKRRRTRIAKRDEKQAEYIRLMAKKAKTTIRKRKKQR